MGSVRTGADTSREIPMLKMPDAEEVKDMRQKELKHTLKERAVKAYEEKEAEFPEAEQLREMERVYC